jgi:hypothetical protein
LTGKEWYAEKVGEYSTLWKYLNKSVVAKGEVK